MGTTLIYTEITQEEYNDLSEMIRQEIEARPYTPLTCVVCGEIFALRNRKTLGAIGLVGKIYAAYPEKYFYIANWREIKPEEYSSKSSRIDTIDLYRDESWE